MGQPLDHTPGTTYAYSNFGYMLLGLVVEAVTGQTYTTYVQNSIFLPLGIANTEIELGRTLPEHRNPREPWYSSQGTAASVFPPHPTVPWPDGGWYLEAMEAHGGLVSSSRALLAFAQAYWFDGAPRSGDGQDWVSFGSLDGTFAMLRWRPDGVNIAAMFNSRDHGPNHEDIWPELDAAADSVTEWPTMEPQPYQVYLPVATR
jgi:N-acyl-D-amino-acid deacylase